LTASLKWRLPCSTSNKHSSGRAACAAAFFFCRKRFVPFRSARLQRAQHAV
jgi:hypothetical protein